MTIVLRLKTINGIVVFSVDEPSVKTFEDAAKIAPDYVKRNTSELIGVEILK